MAMPTGKMDLPKSEQDRTPELLVERVERMVGALARYAADVVAHSPSEPCGEDHVHDIPLAEWRDLIDAWCSADVVRTTHGPDLVAGFRMAVAHFNDEDLKDFILRLV